MNTRRIYTLNGLPPEVVAVAFAKCSRSPEPFDEIANELNEDQSRQFHEKWVVGYGHSSVAEHAVLSIALENVSILATKVIEDNRLASYTEKSSRYQPFDKSRYYRPELDADMLKLYTETVDYMLDTYTNLIPRMTAFIEDKYPDASKISVRNKVFDNLRNMLPVSCLTNLGMTVNARSLAYAIVKLLTHPLKEMNEIGRELKEAALKVTPTLVKYTDYNTYLADTSEHLSALCRNMLDRTPEPTRSVMLVEHDENAVDKIVRALLYRFSRIPYTQVQNKVRAMSDAEKHDIIRQALDRRGDYDSPLREFENTSYTFDILVDYGAFRDIQRHRMMTQAHQDFTAQYGFTIPDEVLEAKLDEPYRECLHRSGKAYHVIAGRFPTEAQYVLAMAFRRRVLFTMNYRELFHFVKLRSSEHGHAAYRKIAQLMYSEVERVQPFLASFIPVNMS